MDNVIDLLEERGMIEQVTDERLRELVERPLKVYCGFDPTANSLHLGNMISIMGLAWFQRCGHTPVALVGGATGMVGDPAGKKHERQLLDAATIEKNLVGISKDLRAVLNSDDPAPVILNNYDWFEKIDLITFLRDIGKHFRIGPMLAKDSVKARFESEEGMSFTEFSYQLLQGYDFLHLYDHQGVTLQLGGSDQWGNIVGGIDLIRKVRGESSYGATFPLLTTSSGQKFGKSEKGAIWLSPEKVSPYDFYQYLFRVSDEEVIKMMRFLTFMPMEEIREWESNMQSSQYAANSAQKKLAEEVTRLVHGEEGVQRAQKATQAAAPGTDAVLNAETLEAAAQDLPVSTLKITEILDQKFVDIFVKIGLNNSKGEVRRLVRNGGAYVNNTKITDENETFKKQHLIDGKFLLLAAGKKNKRLVKIIE